MYPLPKNNFKLFKKKMGFTPVHKRGPKYIRIEDTIPHFT